jgi:hypothetical protein
MRLRVCRQQHLEPTIEQEPIDMIGANSAADAVGRLEHHDRAPGCLERTRRREAGQSGADDHGIVLWRRRHRPINERNAVSSVG